VTLCLRGGSAFHELPEHLLGIDRHEHAAAAGQDFAFGIQDLGGVNVLPTVHADFPTFSSQGFLERHGLEVLNRHLFRHRDHIAQLVCLAHGVVENSRDDAAVAVAGRPGVPFRQAEVADERATFFVKRELQMHTFRIIRPANKAVISRGVQIPSFVAVGLAGHGKIKT